MKRQKRDMEKRAFSAGYRVGASGRSKSLCPTRNGIADPNWMQGWREGRADNWDGFTGVAGIHKSPSLSTLQ